jgi:hypothetical protein
MTFSKRQVGDTKVEVKDVTFGFSSTGNLLGKRLMPQLTTCLVWREVPVSAISIQRHITVVGCLSSGG